MSTVPLLATPDPEDRSALLAAALDAAARGWHVFPLAPGTKKPALHRFDRCPRTGACANGHAGWEQRATTDPDRIRAAWTRGPYNIGLATGPSGLVVIDLDVSDPGQHPPSPWDTEPGVTNGDDVLAALAEQAGQPYPGNTLTVTTPSGGTHLYFTAPAGSELRNTGGDRGRGLGWKIDTRAHGGYVVAPGSTVNQCAYAFVADQQPVPLPGWLLERLSPTSAQPAAPAVPVRPATAARRSRYLDAAIRAEVARINEARDGQRNLSLWVASKALGQLVAGGALTEDEVTNHLFAAAWKHVSVGAYSQSQAMATIQSGLRDGAKQPRQVA